MLSALWTVIISLATVQSENLELDKHLALQADYNRHLRPSHKGRADEVKVGISIFSVGPVSESEMTMTVDFYFRLSWVDHRLIDTFKYLVKHNASDHYIRYIKSLNVSKAISFTNNSAYVTLGGEYSEAVWTPDVYFPDAVDLKVPGKGLISDSMIFVLYEGGMIFQSKRLLMKTRCKMSLTLFPMDIQNCQLCTESYQYPVSEMSMNWWKERVKLEIVKVREFGTANFYIADGHKTTSTDFETQGVVYRKLCMTIKLERKLSIYLVTMYLPSISLVALSWVGFWIDKRAVPARASLTITTILAQITLITGTANQFPGISDLKVADLYLIINFFYVFASLIEFALVSYEPPINRIAKSWLENTRFKLKKSAENSAANNGRPKEPQLTNIIKDIKNVQRSYSPRDSPLKQDSRDNLTPNKLSKRSSSAIGSEILRRKFGNPTQSANFCSNTYINSMNSSMTINESDARTETVLSIPDTLSNNASSDNEDPLLPNSKIGKKRRKLKTFSAATFLSQMKQRLKKFFSRETFSKDNADEISKWLFPISFVLWNFLYFFIILFFSDRLDSIIEILTFWKNK